MNYSTIDTHAIQLRYRNPNVCDTLSYVIGLGLGVIVWTHVVRLVYAFYIHFDNYDEELFRLRKLTNSLQDENIELRDDLAERDAQLASLRATFTRYRNSATRFLESLPDSDSDSD